MKVTKYTVLWLLLFPAVSSGFCFQDAGREYGISPVLLEALARIESNFNPKAINRNGNGSFDIGLMQINSAWIGRLNRNTEDLLSDPCANVMAGAWVLRHCLDAYGYTWEAVGCYNARSSGKRIDYAWKVFRELRNGKASSVSRYVGSSTAGSSLVFQVHEKTGAAEVTGE